MCGIERGKEIQRGRLYTKSEGLLKLKTRMRIHFNHFRGNIHPIYQHLLGFPPEGAEFVNAKDFETEYQKTAVART